ncbi:MAG: hypothetical protein LKE40_14630 [Spirochaetia bacterium]|jgi:hypothetical protein|nr:hypothetical protein [Spirochaetia bacterium]
MDLTKKKLFYLWVPLAVMWVVMALEQPAITAAITRLPNATEELACFGFSFALALMIEGPVVQMLSAGTALSGSLGSYRKILKVMNHLALITLSIHLFLCIPAVFFFVSVRLMNLPEELLTHSYYCFVIMLPWAPVIGYRRLWQGVMIKHERSKQVPYIMYIRLASAGVILTLGMIFKPFSGAILGSVTLACGVTIGTIAAYFFARPIVKDLKDTDGTDTMSYHQTVRFYIPLAITSTVTLGVRPILNYGITLGTAPVQSLAIWPVLLAYISLYTSVTQSVQEIVVAEIKKKTYTIVRNFALAVAVVTELFFLLVYFCKPLWRLWFVRISGVPGDLLVFLPASLALMGLLPFLSGQIAWFRGLLVAERHTVTITIGVILNICTMLAAIFITPQLIQTSGVYIASLAYLAAYAVEFTFLSINCRQYRLSAD